MKNTLITLIVGALFLTASGCSSTVTLGTAANKDGVVGAAASPTGASVTLPLVKAETKATETTTKKKK